MGRLFSHSFFFTFEVATLRRPALSRTSQQTQARSTSTTQIQGSFFSPLPRDELLKNSWQRVELTDGPAFEVRNAFGHVEKQNDVNFQSLKSLLDILFVYSTIVISDQEVNWDYVRVLSDGETVSVDGTHLGHNLPDVRGSRYCINLVSVAGNPIHG